MGGMHKVE